MTASFVQVQDEEIISTETRLRTNLEFFLYFDVITSATSGSASADEPRDALRQLKYYGCFVTELLTRSSANPEEPCEHTVS